MASDQSLFDRVVILALTGAFMLTPTWPLQVGGVVLAAVTAAAPTRQDGREVVLVHPSLITQRATLIVVVHILRLPCGP